jgi:predicted RNase H-like HicB family nuclease
MRQESSLLRMNIFGYEVLLEWNEDYRGYLVVCPKFQACYSQGKTNEEALANIREAIHLCLEDTDFRVLASR